LWLHPGGNALARLTFNMSLPIINVYVLSRTKALKGPMTGPPTLERKPLAERLSSAAVFATLELPVNHRARAAALRRTLSGGVMSQFGWYHGALQPSSLYRGGGLTFFKQQTGFIAAKNKYRK